MVRSRSGVELHSIHWGMILLLGGDLDLMTSRLRILTSTSRRAFAASTREELPRGVYRSFEKNTSPTAAGGGGGGDQLPTGISRVSTGGGQVWPGEGNRRRKVVVEDEDVPLRELPKGLARVGKETPNVNLRRPSMVEEGPKMRLPKGLLKVGEEEKRAERGLPRGVTPINSEKFGMDVQTTELPQGLKRISEAPVRKEKLDNISFERRSEAIRESGDSIQQSQVYHGTIPVVQRPSMSGGVMITPVEGSEWGGGCSRSSCYGVATLLRRGCCTVGEQNQPTTLSVPKSTREVESEVTPVAVEILKVYVSGKSEVLLK